MASNCSVSSVKRTWWLVAAAVVLIQAVRSQRVRVQVEIEAYPTESVDLRCQFIEGGRTTRLTQVSWIWEPVEGQRDNIAVFHPTYGQSFPDPSFDDRVIFTHGTLENPSIRISGLRMADAGRYTCEYATYPSGNEQGTTTLVMLAKPKNTAGALTVQTGTAPLVVAWCEAAEGKPEAAIKWLSSVGGNHSTNTTPAVDGTVTVRSEFRLVPTPADDGREVTCMVSQRTQDQPWVYPIRLSVEYPPSVTIVGYDSNWYVGRSDVVLTCQASANPAPTAITWSSVSGPLPDTVVVEGNRLAVRKVDEAVNTTFVCEARNRLGVSRHQLTASVTEALADPSKGGVAAGAAIGSLLAVLSVAGLVAALVSRGRRRRRRRASYPSNGSSTAACGAGRQGNKDRLLFGASPGDDGKAAVAAAGGNNNGPTYAYRDGCDVTGTLTDRPADYHRHHRRHHRHDDILMLSGDRAEEAERRKLDDSLEDEDEEEEEEQYNRFGPPAEGRVGGGVGDAAGMPGYHLHRGPRGNEDGEERAYLDDDMESQRDGSVISRTAIYV